MPAITARTAKTRRFPHDYVLGRTDREVSGRTDREVWPEADERDGPDREDAAAADVPYRRYPSTSAPPRRPASDHCRRPDTAVQDQDQANAKTETKPKAETKKSENRFFNDVEGLRGIAVALVVLFHAGVPHMAGGFVGVDVFFVISGFLITGLLLREFERNGRVSFRGFYARRARRIIPPAAVAIVATSIAVWFLMPLLSVFRQALDLLAAAMNIANWRFIAAGKDYLAGASDDSVATHFWSLSIEEQFYFVWPVLLVALAVLAKRMRWSMRMVVGWGIAVVTAASMFGVAALYGQRPHPVLYGDPHARMAIRRRRTRRGGGAAADRPDDEVGCANSDVGARLGWTVGGAGGDGGLRPHHALSGRGRVGTDVGAAAIIVAGQVAASSRPAVGWFLSVRPLRWLGKVSYGWYLWHWPALVLFKSYTHNNSWPTLVGVTMGALVLAWVSTSLLERPIMSSKELKRNLQASLSVGFTGTIAAAAVTMTLGVLAVNMASGAASSNPSVSFESVFGADTGAKSGPVTPNPFKAFDDRPDRDECLVPLGEREQPDTCVDGPARRRASGAVRRQPRTAVAAGGSGHRQGK